MRSRAWKSAGSASVSPAGAPAAPAPPPTPGAARSPPAGDGIVRSTGRPSTPVQHPVDDDTGDRDPGPEREGEAREPSVRLEVSAERTGDGHDDEGGDDAGEDGVVEKDGEVDDPPPPLSGEADRADLCVVHEIAGEEQGGGGERTEHKAPLNVAASQTGR